MANQEQTGMTLVELLVAMAMSSLLIGGIYGLFQIHHRMAVKQEETTLMQQELLGAISVIADELRMCGFSPWGRPGFGFAHLPAVGAPQYGRATNGTSIYCALDWNGDGVINENGTGSGREHVGFRLNVANNGSPKPVADNVLRRYDTGAVHWQPVATNIANLDFAYLDAAGNVIPDPGANPHAIRIVRVLVTAAPSAHRAHLGIGNRTMSTNVQCRNLKD